MNHGGPSLHYPVLIYLKLYPRPCGWPTAFQHTTPFLLMKRRKPLVAISLFPNGMFLKEVHSLVLPVLSITAKTRHARLIILHCWDEKLKEFLPSNQIYVEPSHKTSSLGLTLIFTYSQKLCLLLLPSTLSGSSI